ncbi:SipW-cognate class signal peptide [Quadrisphaera granulorum]|uniref:Putative ribosomally synthesized peptide with SipW-like signal peptide n=1 Tax=Quadrisphaera granulorum TaxID=317664 RepID=A0A315ZTZ3_9ACTN|nr:SipW-dependent-type signal peptide-containing protein [Quadrisphaera granulorum]PWJ49015.1 putative ribosomally synthesized peptide with SipW-like signal peptide [Quadrisphaera granulorum]SZE98225.1 SipW-cognate class signal peptide [Quadrisphaera granulorum]
MNGRILKASLAGAGALALLGAGTTYAAFSSTSTVEASRVSAASFSVGVASAGSASSGSLVPGGAGVSQTFLVENKSATPASLGAELANLVDRENGCSGDEKQFDDDCDSNSGKFGDLSNQALISAVAFPAVAGKNVDARCPAATAGGPGVLVGPLPTAPVTTTKIVTKPGSTTTSTVVETYLPAPDSLAAVVNGPRYFDFSGLAPVPPATAACVRLTLTLPLRDDNNAVQSDTSSFDVRLRLAQVVAAAPSPAASTATSPATSSASPTA